MFFGVNPVMAGILLWLWLTYPFLVFAEIKIMRWLN